MTWFRGSIARLPISLSSIREAWATSIAEPSWVKVAPASKLQLTSMLKVTMSWYEMRSEERRVGKGVDLGGRRIIKKKKKKKNRKRENKVGKKNIVKARQRMKSYKCGHYS